MPDSFFKPPEKGTKTPTHSRQGSIDSTLLLSPSPSSTAINPQNLNQQIHKKILNNNHLRSNSEPVLINSFSLAASQQQQDTSSYVAQRQSSVCSEKPLPHGWESLIASNGQRYYIK